MNTTDKTATDFEYWRHIVGTENARYMRYGKEMLEALRGLVANAPTPKRIRDDFSYILYLEAARTAIAKAEGKTP